MREEEEEGIIAKERVITRLAGISSSVLTPLFNIRNICLLLVVSCRPVRLAEHTCILAKSTFCTSPWTGQFYRISCYIQYNIYILLLTVGHLMVRYLTTLSLTIPGIPSFFSSIWFLYPYPTLSSWLLP